ncbi:MAG: hypothetical protein ACFWTY_05680 [Shouchella clausii]
MESLRCRFYMNLVGYKAALRDWTALLTRSFYMNLVGYKVKIISQKRLELAFVLYELSGL